MKDNKNGTKKDSFESYIKGKANGEVLYCGNDKARFILGKSRANPIICFGINPSTANDKEDDPTILKIRKIA